MTSKHHMDTNVLFRARKHFKLVKVAGSFENMIASDKFRATGIIVLGNNKFAIQQMCARIANLRNEDRVAVIGPSLNGNDLALLDKEYIFELSSHKAIKKGRKNETDKEFYGGLQNLLINQYLFTRLDHRAFFFNWYRAVIMNVTAGLLIKATRKQFSHAPQKEANKIIDMLGNNKYTRRILNTFSMSHLGLVVVDDRGKSDYYEVKWNQNEVYKTRK